MIPAFLIAIIAALVAIPVQDGRQWETLTFDGVKGNSTSFARNEITIRVNDSSSPLLHVLPAKKSVSRIRVTGTVDGTMTPNRATSWNKAPDDSYLRVGLIESGNRRLNRLERLSAPGWVKEIESKVGDRAKGVANIHCFHVMPDDRWVGESRQHPKMPVFLDEATVSPDASGKFVLESSFDAIDTVGVWLLADGDDSGSSFTVTIQSVEFGLAE